jgi:hypothetical protein
MKNESLFTRLSLSAICFMLCIPLSISAFTYTITFTGSQASTSVVSVEVQNLTKGTNVTVPIESRDKMLFV